jgi:hypothetical protein
MSFWVNILFIAGNIYWIAAVRPLTKTYFWLNVISAAFNAYVVFGKVL